MVETGKFREALLKIGDEVGGRKIVRIAKFPDGAGGLIELPVLEEGPKPKTPEEVYKTLTPLFYENRILSYRLFAERIYNPKNVFYPCCDMDASPVRAFPDADVTLLDINEHAVNALNRNGVRALCLDIRDYQPARKHDLIILLNPMVRSDLAVPSLESDGYALANNYHKNALQLAKDPNFSKVGTIIQTGKLEFKIVDRVENLNNDDWAFADRFYIFRKK